MAEDRIKKAYRRSQSVYDDTLSQQKLWAKLYIKFFWGGVDDNALAQKILQFIPSDFKGKLLDVPVGTAVFTADKFLALPQAAITGLDYSEAMLDLARERLAGDGRPHQHIRLLQGDVGALPFADESFDIVLSMNGFHAFPDKEKAFAEIFRVLRRGGMFCGCFYICGESKRTDFLVHRFLGPKGWFTPPYRSFAEVKEKLAQNFSRSDVRHEKAMVYFQAVK